MNKRYRLTRTSSGDSPRITEASLMPRWRDSSPKSTQPAGYYIDPGTYRVMPKSRSLSKDEAFDAVTGITPEVHTATANQCRDHHAQH
jgi:hypothetical protein